MHKSNDEITTDGIELKYFNLDDEIIDYVRQCSMCSKIYPDFITEINEMTYYCWHCLFILNDDEYGMDRLKRIII